MLYTVINRSEWQHTLLLNTDKKYMGNTARSLNTAISDIERSRSRSLRLWMLVFRKCAEFHTGMFLFNTNRKSCIGHWVIRFDRRWHWKVKFKVTWISKVTNLLKIPVSAYVTARKSYMGRGPSVSLDLALSYIGRARTRPLVFRTLYFRK